MSCQSPMCVSWLARLCVLVLVTTGQAMSSCVSNISSGTSWQNGDVNFTYFDLNVTDSVRAPPYPVHLYGQAALADTWDWNMTTDLVTGFDNTLLPTSPVTLGVIAASLPESPDMMANISGLDVGGGLCMTQITQEGSDAQAAVESGIQPVSVAGGKLLGVDGAPLALKGINYFGFETVGGSMLDGLWISSTSLTGDFATIVYRIQLLGFNAVRIPFSFKNLYGGAPPTSFTQACATDSLQTVAAATLDPAFSPVPAPEPIFMPPGTPGVCNSYLPNSDTLNRFLFVLNVFAQNRIYIMIDNHLNLDSTITDNPDAWVQDWKNLATSIAQDPITSPWVMFDIANEPDSLGLRWEAANGLPGMTDYYLKAMDAISEVIPQQVFMIEGLGQVGQAINWGLGTITDQTVIALTGISDPSPFFTQLAAKSYLNNVVMAPHVYGPSISHDASYSGTALFDKLSRAVGYLNKQGFCVSPDNCHVFPIVVGETGSALTDSRDFDFFESFIQYITNTGPGNDGLHNAIDSVFFWAWNANSGDTHGLVEDDWTAMNYLKVQLLQHLQGLTPYYAPTPPEPTSPLNRGGGAAVQSFDGTQTVPPPNLFPQPLRGFVLTLQDLAESGAVITGDLPTVLQRMRALGFSALQVPFNHTLVNITHPCIASNQSTLLDAVFAPSFNLTNLTAISRGALPSQTDLPESPTCNTFVAGMEWPQQLAAIADLAVRNSMYILLQDVDSGLALADPDKWLLDLAGLAASLYSTNATGNNTMFSFVGYSDEQPTSISWDSAGQPGLGELQLAGMQVVSRILPEVIFVAEGAGGDDFDDSGNFFRRALGAGFVSDLAAYASGHDMDADLTSFLALGSTGVCLTQASCQQLPLISSVDPYIDNATATGGWFATLPDALSITLDEVTSLQTFGLQPYFAQPSAYNPLAGPAIDSAGVQSGEQQYCQVTARTTATSEQTSSGYTFGLHLEVANSLPNTIYTPWSFSLNWNGLTRILHAWGFDSLSQSPGSANMTNAKVSDVLWPAGLNSLDKLLIVQAQTTNLTNAVVSIGGQACVMTLSDA